MNAALARLKPYLERVDRLSLRERGLLFAGGIVVLYLGWQSLLMDPVAHRVRAAEQRLAEVRRRGQLAEEAGAAAAQDPAIAAAARNRALDGRLKSLDAELGAAAEGYVAPEKMADLLRQLLLAEQGLRLLSLRNLPAVSLSRPAPAADAPAGEAPLVDHGPFLHPVELVVEGDYASVVAYLHALEKLPWRIHWQRLELLAGDSPANRVRIVIGALSLSRDWMAV